MFRSIPVCFLAFAAICASTVLASAQITSSSTGASSTTASPAAFVYVSHSQNGSTSVINGYAAAANGTLTPIPGSPFPWNVNYLALTNHWLFAIQNSDPSTGSQFVYSLSIAPNGALTKKDELNVAQSRAGLISIYLDHTGSTLYGDYYTTNNDYFSYTVNHSTGALSFLGDLPGGPSNNSPVSFIGNNVFAYSSSCYHFDPVLVGVQRASDGTLSYLNGSVPPFPTEKSGGFYCPWQAAADPTNHLAIALQPLNSNWGDDGPWQLATYTADASGNLTTNSTFENMPTVAVGAVNDYQMSPSGKFLAVGGNGGLQLFHFNGANPITKLTGSLTASPVDQLFWDNANHVYAISRSAGKLYVFSVTATGAKQAPGSPHMIAGPQNIIVLPK